MAVYVGGSQMERGSKEGNEDGQWFESKFCEKEL